MKKMKNTWLFFYLSFTCISGCFINTINAQQVIDSSYYYYERVLKPKSGNDLISGYIFFDNHKNQSLQRKDTLQAIYDLRLMIISQHKMTRYYDSQASIIEALNLIDHLKVVDSSVIADKIGLFNSLGNTYRALDKYESAIKIYDEALEVVQISRDSLIIYNNKANVYKDQGKLQLAKEMLEYIYNNRFKFGKNKHFTRALDNYGSIQGKLGDPEGLTNMLQALEMRKEQKTYQYFYVSYKNLSEYYKDAGDLKTARYYARLGYDAASLYREPYKMDALSNLLLLEDNPLQTEYIKMNDSITKVRLLNENKYSSAKYNLKKEQKRAFSSELERLKEKSKRQLSQGITVFIVLLGLCIFVFLRSKYRKNTLLEVYNTETRISKKVHDEVANDVFHVMNKLESGSGSKEDIMDYLEGIYNKTRDISRENNSIDVAENFEALLRDLLLSYSSQEVNIITRNISKIDWDSMPDIKKMTIYRVLQEFMTNMKKHSEASLVVLGFIKDKNKVIIEYSDNGKGFNGLKLSGLQNAENRIISINGTINFDTELEKGFKVQIKV